MPTQWYRYLIGEALFNFERYSHHRQTVLYLKKLQTLSVDTRLPHSFGAPFPYASSTRAQQKTGKKELCITKETTGSDESSSHARLLFSPGHPAHLPLLRQSSRPTADDGPLYPHHHHRLN